MERGTAQQLLQVEAGEEDGLCSPQLIQLQTHADFFFGWLVNKRWGDEEEGRRF